MFKKLMKHLTNNPGLKILSVLIAVVLWLVVVNYDNPEITKPFRVPITITNEDVLEDMGKVYEVVDDTSYATIYVTGKRKILDTLSADDFKAVADLSQANFQSTNEKKIVPIGITAKRYESKLSITQKTVNLQITLEDLSTQQSYISCDTQGTPAEGFAIGEVTVSPNLIKISGPQSVVSRISRVAAIVNVEGLSEDITENVIPVLYDEEGNVIESSQLKLSQQTVTASVQILGTKKVPVVCAAIGTPADGYQFISLEYAPETIAIKGDPSVLDNIYEIVIPEDEVNIEGATGDVENSIDISGYLEELGVSLVNSEESKIAVKAVIERLETKVIEFPTDSLTIENLPEDYEITIGSTVSITVRGRSEELAELTANQLQAVLDLDDLLPGTHVVTVQVTVDEKFQVMGEVTMVVQIIEKDDEPLEEPTGGEDGTGNQTGTNGGTDTGTGGNSNTGNNTEDDTGNTRPTE